MTTRIVADPAPWNAEVFEGLSETRVNYTCTRCRTSYGINYQPLPWTDADGSDLTTISTQLWCPQCERGVDVELIQE